MILGLFGGQSLQSVIDAQGGRTSGFDLMRLGLAVAVILIHTVCVCYGEAANLAMWAGPYRPLVYYALPMFFVLSGFLVSGSLERTKGIHRFMGLRAIRIVPALAVETFLCAILLGALVTSWDLADYFTTPGFFAYFLNIVGVIQYHLPGVFMDLPTTGIVNVSLWTVPYELECYLALALLFVFGVTRRRAVMAALVAAACLIAPFVFPVPDYMGRPTGQMLVLCFLCGVSFYQFRDKIPHNPLLALAAAAISLWLFTGQTYAFWGAPFAAYVTAYLGLLKAPKLPVVMSGDYSYGLYLFAFPLQQLHAHLFPDARIWYWNGLFALTLGLAYAAFSWHVVEKPILARRNEILGWFEKIGTRAWNLVRRPAAPAMSDQRVGE